MYYLDENFKPMIIVLTIPFLPVLIMLLFANVMSFNVGLMILFVVVLTLYLSIALILWKLSKRQKHYLSLKDEVEIVFEDQVKGASVLHLNYDQIVRMKYYRITSLRNWFMLFSFVFPTCVYITYHINGYEQTQFIGYMNYRDIIELCEKNNIELIIY